VLEAQSRVDDCKLGRVRDRALDRDGLLVRVRCENELGAAVAKSLGLGNVRDS
jgi:hypothetical protein